LGEEEEMKEWRIGRRRGKGRKEETSDLASRFQGHSLGGRKEKRHGRRAE